MKPNVVGLERVEGWKLYGQLWGEIPQGEIVEK